MKEISDVKPILEIPQIKSSIGDIRIKPINDMPNRYADDVFNKICEDGFEVAELSEIKSGQEVDDGRRIENPKLMTLREADEVFEGLLKSDVEMIDTVETDNNEIKNSDVATRDATYNQTDSPEYSKDGTRELTDEEKTKIKEETGWSNEIIDNITNMKQYEVLKNAGLKEVEINGRKCLIKENIDLDYADKDGITNREKMVRGLSPLDSKTGKTLQLHHLGQKADSPLVELTEEEHRTGEYEDGKKNQSLWHDNTKETEVHGEGNSWKQEREAHWKERIKDS